MSEVHRYKVVKMLSEGGNKLTYTPHGPWIVMAEAFDAEHALRRKAERQVGELRDSLTELNGIERKRDAAVALLREHVEWFDDGVGRSLKEFHLFQRGREFINTTTSTEGKDHE